MIHVRISTDTLMSRRRIRCWSDWQAAAIYEKVIACWIMGAEKDVWTFFLFYQTRCRSVGVEYDSRIYETVCENKRHAVSGSRTEFVMGNAENYVVPAEVDRVFFFNPFSVEILRKVLAKIEDSYYENPREIQLFFYYPSDEYISELMTVDMLSFVDEIDCRDLFDGENPRERIMVFAY